MCYQAPLNRLSLCVRVLWLAALIAGTFLL